MPTETAGGQHIRDTPLGQVVDQGGVASGVAEDETVDAASQQCLQSRALQCEVVAGVGHDRLIARLQRDVVDALIDHRQDDVGQARNKHADDMRPPGSQRGSRGIGQITQFVRDRTHPLRRGRRDAARCRAQCARHRRGGDTGAFGDGGERSGRSPHDPSPGWHVPVVPHSCDTG